jgi:gas vesicle protein
MAMEFNKKDVLAALGMETDSGFWTVALAGFGVGCLVGAAVAVMVAPKSGRELRSDLMEKGRDLMSRGKEELQSNMNMGNQSKPITPTY